MARVFIALLVLLVALSLIPLLAGNTGYVLISFGSWAIDGTAVAFIVWALMILLAIWFLLFAFVRGRRVGRAIARFFSIRSDKKITMDIESGVVAFAEQDWQTAAKTLERVAPYTEHQDSFMLMAAYAASNVGNSEQAFELVHKIESADLQLKAKSLAVKIDDGELIAQMLEQGKDVTLPVTVAIEQNDWNAAADALKQVKPSRHLSEDIVNKLYAQVLSKWLPHVVKSQSLDAMIRGWQSLPKVPKTLWSNVRIFVPLLIENGKQDIALDTLKPWLKKQPDDDILIEIAKMPWTDPSVLVRKVQGWLKKDDSSIALLAATGHLAARSGDYDLAKKTLSHVVHSTNKSQDWLAFAEACDRVGDKASAMEAYKKAAETSD